MNLNQDTDSQFFAAFLTLALEKNNSLGHLEKQMALQQFRRMQLT